MSSTNFLFSRFFGGDVTRRPLPQPPRDEQRDPFLCCQRCGRALYWCDLAALWEGALFCPGCGLEEAPLWSVSDYLLRR